MYLSFFLRNIVALRIYQKCEIKKKGAEIMKHENHLETVRRVTALKQGLNEQEHFLDNTTQI